MKKYSVLLQSMTAVALVAGALAGTAQAADPATPTPRYGAANTSKPSAKVDAANKKYRDKVAPAAPAKVDPAAAKTNPSASRRYKATPRADFRKATGK
ncbi:MAG: hypothetical protein WCO67_15890 [Betaproteobacteria bacterium]